MSRMPVKTIAVLGGVVQDLTTIIDQIPDDGETVIAYSFTKQPGGKGSSSAVAMYRLTRPNPKDNADASLEDGEDDIRVRMVGAVGDDELGPALIENLINCGVNADGVRVIEGKLTAMASILVEKGSGASRIMQYPGAAYALEPADFLTLESLGGGVAPDFIILQLENRRDTIEQAIETAHREGIEVLLKPSPARYLMPEIYRMISHLVMNQTEAVCLSRLTPVDIEDDSRWPSIADYFLNLGVENVVITLGENGAYYSNESSRGYVEADKNCTVLDTSGAGYVTLPM